MTENNINRLFSEDEIRGIRDGIDGVKRAIPARFYHDEAIYQYEVEHLLKKNWLCVGRWDQAENPGDYFTIRMWGESIVVVRDEKNALHALINVCQHRWSQVVEDGSGNARLFKCPYHNWTYNLDGRLRGMSVQDIPGVDKKKCGLPRLRIEEWHGFIFINFDIDAQALSPQLEAVSPYLEKYQAGTYKHTDMVEYQAPWNWKFSFETGYEGYHHSGLHFKRLEHIAPAINSRPLKFGKACGSYTVVSVEGAARETPYFVAVYPSLIMFLSSTQVTYIHIQHQGVASNLCSTRQSFSPAVFAEPGGQETIATSNQTMRDVQEEDTFGCTMLQKGITSRTNTGSMIHPLERQLNHYHNWYMDQLLNSQA